MENSAESTMFQPLNDAAQQIRELNERTVKFAQDAAADIRDRSEETLRTMRSRLEEAQKAFEDQRSEFEIAKLPEIARQQFQDAEQRFRVGVEELAKSFNLVTAKDLDFSEVDALKRRVTDLERRLSEVERQQQTEAA